MAFWNKRIDLGEDFYRAVGECLLDTMQCRNASQEINLQFMYAPQACDFLNLVKNGFISLESVINRFPIASASLIDKTEIKTNVEACDQKRNGILRLSEKDQNAPLSFYDGTITGLDVTHFLRSVLNMESILLLSAQKATQQMAKAANTNHNEFITMSLQTVRETPRGKAIHQA